MSGTLRIHNHFPSHAHEHNDYISTPLNCITGRLASIIHGVYVIALFFTRLIILLPLRSSQSASVFCQQGHVRYAYIASLEATSRRSFFFFSFFCHGRSACAGLLVAVAVPFIGDYLSLVVVVVVVAAAVERGFLTLAGQHK